MLDFAYKIPGVFKQFQEPEIEFSRSVCKKISMPYIVFQCFLIFFPTSCKLSARTGILSFAFSLSPIVNLLNF